MAGLTIAAGVTVDAGGNVITNAAPGVNPSDVAVVSQLTAGATGYERVASSAPVTIADGASGLLNLDLKEEGDDLLDLSVPTAPAVVDPGLYVVTVSIQLVSVMTVGGYYLVYLNLDTPIGGVGSAQTMAPPSSAGNQTPRTSASCPMKMNAAGTISVLVYNFDGAAANDFLVIEAVIAKQS